MVLTQNLLVFEIQSNSIQSLGKEYFEGHLIQIRQNILLSTSTHCGCLAYLILPLCLISLCLRDAAPSL